MKPVIIALVALLGLLQYALWLAPGGLVATYRLHRHIVLQTQANHALTLRNAQLMADINDLKHGNEAIEERARNDLGFIKKGEVFYQVVKDKHD